jgi:hypothetical protein
MTAPAPHLGLEDLIAGLDDAPMDEAAQLHLFSCPDCRSEAVRWRTAADGVRTLVGSCAAPPWQSVDIFSAPGGPGAGRARRQRSRSSRPNPLRRRHMLAICTAALALTIAAAFEIGALSYSGSSGATGAAPFASPSAPSAPSAPRTGAPVGGSGVFECNGADLELATGPLIENDDGAAFRVAVGGRSPVPVRTTGSTTVQLYVSGTVSDIANGDHVAVLGTSENGTITSSAVGIAPGDSDAVPIPSMPAPGFGGPSSGLESTDLQGTGTVEDVSGTGFTLVTSNEDIPVTVSASTLVTELVDSVAQALQPGRTTSVAGTPSADGTLVAESIVQVGPGFQPVAGAAAIGRAVSFSGLPCLTSAFAANALIESIH